MSYNWYKVFNKTEFEALGLVSAEYSFIFKNVGLKSVLVTQGNYLAVKFDDVFLTLNLNDKNPFEFENRAIYLDENDDVWVGIAVED